MKRILIVDDEESIRVSLAALISRHGYNVETTGTGGEALSMLSTNDFDVAFIDLRMPEMDGIELARLISQRQIPTTVIVMSAYGSVDNAIEAMKAGAYDFITKPFKTDEVILTLAKAQEREGLRRENAILKSKMISDQSFHGIISRSSAMAEVFALIRKVADVNSTVLITGESGTGKELIARAIHNQSPRRDRPFVAINCGAIPENLIESELFGYKKGAFTDAQKDKTGLFLEASGGTLLLDEIGELPYNLQVKMLRVLQEGRVRPLGDTRDVEVDVRILAATLQNLEDRVQAGLFREDLFYRLNVLQVKLPPLRKRTEDIPLLVEHFIARQNQRLNTHITGVTREAEKMLIKYSWPGNIRELENIVERAIILADEDLITASELPDKVQNSSDAVRISISAGELSIKKTTRMMEEELIRKALAKTNGNRTAAAKILEISHRALLYKIKQYGI